MTIVTPKAGNNKKEISLAIFIKLILPKNSGCENPTPKNIIRNGINIPNSFICRIFIRPIREVLHKSEKFLLSFSALLFIKLHLYSLMGFFDKNYTTKNINFIFQKYI